MPLPLLFVTFALATSDTFVDANANRKIYKDWIPAIKLE
jgi:hypothetical protein